MSGGGLILRQHQGSANNGDTAISNLTLAEQISPPCGPVPVSVGRGLRRLRKVHLVEGMYVSSRFDMLLGAGSRKPQF